MVVKYGTVILGAWKVYYCFLWGKSKYANYYTIHLYNVVELINNHNDYIRENILALVGYVGL